MCRFLFLACLLSLHLQGGLARDTVFCLDKTSSPIAVRQEKAQLLTRLWNLESGYIAEEFSLETESGLARAQHALDAFLTASNNVSTASEIPSRVDHYLVWMLARADIVNDLDFSDDALRHFYTINPKQYPCQASASISELLVPHAYLDALGTTAVLETIRSRLQREKFAVVSYDITGQISGKPETGLKGTVTAGQIGAERFQLYQQTWDKPDSINELGRIAGPFKTDRGYLFVEIYSFSSGESGSCYEFYYQKISQDYGREWLKKIYSDTLTTAMRELRPEVSSFTSGTSTEATAYIVDGHKSTFRQAHELLPFLLGDGRDPRFWQSIQRQALELELIYHGSIGKEIRAGEFYSDMRRAMSALSAAKSRLDMHVAETVTSEAVQREFSANTKRYSDPVSLSFTIYSSGDSPDGAAKLVKLADDKSGTTVSLQVTEKRDVRWSDQPREIQVAAQALQRGQWSEVFPYQGKPHRLYLHSIKREMLPFEDVKAQIREQLEISTRQKFWRQYFQIDSIQAGGQ